MSSPIQAEKINDQPIKTITDGQANFPLLLKTIYRPVKKLWYRGDIRLASQKKLLAIVGSRQASWYGQLAIDQLLTPIIVKNLVIVSGLAAGIDSLAHQVALKFKSPTIAVLGSGLARQSLYPPSNWQLAEQIVQHGGLLLSEYPPTELARSYYFPQRNRIIAGLSSTVLVIEAAKKSGALITAKLALQEGRDVLAVPGNINQPLSVGTNQLIQLGAQPIIQATDLALALDLPQPTSYSEINHPATDGQTTLWNILIKPLSLDELAQVVDWPINQITEQLTDLELAGLVKQQADNTYVAC